MNIVVHTLINAGKHKHMLFHEYVLPKVTINNIPVLLIKISESEVWIVSLKTEHDGTTEVGPFKTWDTAIVYLTLIHD